MWGACSRRRSRSPRGLEEEVQEGPNAAPLTALPVRRKPVYEELAGTPAPSAPHPCEGGVWQRSPVSGLLRAWLLPSPLSSSPLRVGSHTTRAILGRFGVGLTPGQTSWVAL